MDPMEAWSPIHSFDRAIFLRNARKSLEVLHHRDHAAFEFDLCVEQCSPVAGSSQVRKPSDGIFLKNQDWRKPPSLKVVIQERRAALRVSVDEIEAVISHGKVSPVSEVQRIRDEIF